jgi:hypothetical protein
MSQIKNVLGIEIDFVNVLESLSNRECRFNKQLRVKTKKVAELLSKVAEVKQSLAVAAQTSAQGEGACS